MRKSSLLHLSLLNNYSLFSTGKNGINFQVTHCFQQEKMVLTFKGGTRVFVARIPSSVTDDDFGRYQILDHIHHLFMQLVISSRPKCFKGRMHH